MTKKEYSVVVTGFGANLNAPYGNNTSNPSSLIARSLPHSLPPSHPLNPTDSTITLVDGVANDFAEIYGTYAKIRQRLRDLHAQYGTTVDLWVHLGRSPWPFVTVERKAFRQDFTSSWLGEDARKGYYNGPDNEKNSVNDIGPNPWLDVPMGLNTEIDVNAVVRDSNVNLAKGKDVLEVRSHLEAAAMGCGFCYYESLANCWVAGKRRDVLFCHVPRGVEEGDVEKGREAILAVVGAAVKAIGEREGRSGEGDWKQEFGLEP
ncbi:hypothetical protein PRZ48_005644 [Zasmidium cellare]|uniref:Peptidase C15, pyroglutamyl peptidase I-like protein n=1 Tax=Zasmidium cellare TaxID=395010 RepID=A0ABR0EKW2_ZASCE|nr:hypothetical protein PRZ48_005644 [Zasmidium cellare]